MTELTICEADGGVTFTAKIVPGSSKTAVCGVFNGMLKVKVSAPAEKGKANQSLLKFLAKQIGVKRNAVSIIRGQTSTVKDVQVTGISGKELLEKLK